MGSSQVSHAIRLADLGDRVVQFVLAAAERAGFSVMVEPRIVGRTLGVRKPDLVLWDKERAFVADIKVTSAQVGELKHIVIRSPIMTSRRFGNGCTRQLWYPIFPFRQLPPIGGVCCHLSVQTF